MAEQDAARPTFESFWKEGKQKEKESQVSFVTDTSPSGTKQESTSPKDGKDTSTDPDAAQDKAKIRRAQVRKAQIQHRQRKANYVGKLESDVAHYRELISRAELQSQILARENEAFREKLRQAAHAHNEPQATVPIQQQTLPDQNQLTLAAQPSFSPVGDQDLLRMQFEAQNLDGLTSNAYPQQENELFSNIDLDVLTVTLSMDETMGTPCLNVSSSSPGPSDYSAVSPVAGGGPAQQLSPAQEQMAVNFILALEYVCWDHFSEDHMNHVEEYLEGNLGHTLMASAYCMAQAPDSVYSELNAFNDQPNNPPTLQWPGGISLSTLHGLALSLADPVVEITPVQAWFDLSSRYPVTLLLDPNILASLKREFRSIVRCVYYGAVMDREAYEMVVSRVLGTMPLIPGTSAM